MRAHSATRSTLLTLSLLALPAAALGQMTFELDPITLEVLETDVDTDSAKFEEYRDLGSGLRIAELVIRGTTADTDRHFELLGENLGRDDSRLGLRYGVWDSWALELDYNKIPHRFGNSARILWDRSSPGSWTISDALQAYFQDRLTAAFPAVNVALINSLVEPLLAEGDRIDLGLRRDRFGAELELGGLDGLSWTLGLQHENRVGTRAFGASFGFGNVTELPEPIDYDTTAAELRGEWVTGRGALRFGYKWSRFENNISTLVWDNPFRITDSTDPNAYQAPGNRSIGGAVHGFADLAPDNEANQFFAGGRWKVGDGWWAGGNVSYSLMTQDDPLLPYTLNSAIQGHTLSGMAFDATNPANLPVASADAEAKSLDLSADFGGRFAEDFSLVLRYRYSDYDNSSARILFPGYVRYHGVWEDIPRITVPYSTERDSLSATLGWDLGKSHDLELAWTHKRVDRTFREAEQTEEDIIKLSWDSRPLPWLSLRASAEHGDRTYDHYEPEAAEASFADHVEFSSLLGLRRFDVANREYDGVSLSAQAQLGERWSVSGAVETRDEDYPDSEFGLVSDDVLQLDLELAWMVSEASNLTLFASRTDRDDDQRSRQSGATPSTNPADDWSLFANEVNDLVGLGYNGEVARWSWESTLRWSRSDGEADLESPPGGSPDGAVDIGNYEDIELLAAELTVDYALSEQASVGLRWLYEDYTLDSFILQGLNNVLPGAIILNANNGDYTANVVGAHLKLAW